jgi:hypothetical protein
MTARSVRFWVQLTALQVVVPIVLVFLISPQSAGSAQPTLTVSPSPSNGAYRDGETVTVMIGPNSLFTPNLKVNILECSDPGGTAANLPKSVAGCDGNTIQGETILIQADGSFSTTDYTLYALPSRTLGEQANWQPVCNATNPCVLYVGQNQEDFTQPKLFSAPFTFSGAPNPVATTSGSTPTTSGSTPTTSGSTPTTSGPSASTTAPGEAAGTTASPAGSTTDPSATESAALADTGPSSLLPWLSALALLLVALGTAGRRWLTRVDR